MKASFLLGIDELAAVVGFLNGNSLVGLDERLFAAFSEENLPLLMKTLEGHGMMLPGERKGTWHIQEDLMQTAAVAVAPQFAVLARSPLREGSVVFYLADKEITEIVVGERVLLASLYDLGELCVESLRFFGGHLPAELLVARVKGESFDEGQRVEVLADDWETVLSSLRRALQELGAKPIMIDHLLSNR